MPHKTTRPTAALLLAVALGCAGADPSSPDLLPEAVSVSAGLSPQITWVPGGAVYSVTVSESHSGNILWTAEGQRGANAIRPSVLYASTPPGAIATAIRTYPLVSGVHYRVDLARVDSAGVLRLVGSVVFTP